MVRHSPLLAITIITAGALPFAFGFDNSRFDNNSYGATHSDTANFQKTLSYYCQDDSIDVIPIAFVNTFFSDGGLPILHLANICNPTDNATFPGTKLPNCSALASDVALCQSKGKILTISLGGAGGGVGLASDAQGVEFANTLWNLFLGGSSSTRPLGSAVLDGVDLDIESGGSTGYAAMINRLRTLANGWSKKLYITAAPQCVFPDSALGGVLNAASFDAIYVQFYNNPCGLTHANEANNWNYGLWDYWARNTSPNKNVKVYIAAPAAPLAAGSGYLSPSDLATVAVKMRKSYPNFGGVALWDSSQAYVNNRYEKAIKTALAAAGGTGFTYPACSAPAYSAGTGYTGGSQVTYNGYIWQAKWYASVTPAASESNDWQIQSACSGNPTDPGTPSGGCTGVAAWSSTSVYTGGMTATYNWSSLEGETPGVASVWVDQGTCTAKSASSKSEEKTVIHKTASITSKSTSIQTKTTQLASEIISSKEVATDHTVKVAASAEATASLTSSIGSKETAHSRFFRQVL
ncbi:class III chitinase [Flagelloscypha sp. PMI_526]|nr:class III chitinase [Flagelloscypha sp. PMI_526]